MSETPFEPFTTDNYFEQYDIPTVFVVKGQKIIVASKRLADALLKLPEQRRTVLLMYFFLGYTDTEVGNEYGYSRSTANYWKHAAFAICAGQRPLVRLPAAARRSPTATFIKVFR